MSQRQYSEWFVTRWRYSGICRPNNCVVNGTNRCFMSGCWGCWQASHNQRICALSRGARSDYGKVFVNIDLKLCTVFIRSLSLDLHIATWACVTFPSSTPYVSSSKRDNC